MRPSLAVAASLLLASRALAQCPPAPEGKSFSPAPVVGGFFGDDVAIDGNRAFVGSPNVPSLPAGQGAVDVFERVGAAWVHVQTVVPVAAEFQRAGHSIAADGGAIVSGASRVAYAGQTTGAAFVFEDSGAGYVQTALLVAPDRTVSDNFGASVAVSGDLVAVGAPAHFEPNGASGAVYVFERDTFGTWAFSAKIAPVDGAFGDDFGALVALAGSRLVVASPRDDSAATDAGSIYVFDRVAGAWVQAAEHFSPDAGPSVQFGFSLDFDGATGIVGSPNSLDAAGMSTGAAYVFDLASGPGAFVVKLLASDAARFADVGWSVAVDGDRILVGAPSTLLSGATYVFRRAGVIWSEVAKLTSASSAFGSGVGWATASRGGRAIASAPSDQEMGFDSGAVYHFDLGSGPEIVTQPADDCGWPGATATFTVAAAGPGPITYAWRKGAVPLADGGNISGAATPTLTIAALAPGDAGRYACDVTNACGGVSTRPARLVVETLSTILAGNVNGGAGPVADVLFVNGGNGGPPDRRIALTVGDPFRLRIEVPPAGPASAVYVVYVWGGEPKPMTCERLPGNTGTIAMPTPFSGRAPQPKKIANTTGSLRPGATDWPGPPLQLAPHTLLDRPNGLGVVVKFTLQGIIQDAGAPNGVAAVTNGIIVSVN